VAKYHGARAGGVTGALASEIKTLKIYLSAKYNYPKLFIYYVYFINGNF
jgi:hypothetical protein